MNSQNKKRVTWGLVVLVLLCFFFSSSAPLIQPVVKPVIEKISAMINKPVDYVVRGLRHAAWIGVGIISVWVGIAMLGALPIVGVVLAVVGLALIAATVWSLFKKEKPSNVNLSKYK